MPGGAAGSEERSVRRRPAPARVVAAAVIVGAIVILVFQNSQKVTLRFWFITGHVRLIWVIVVSAVVGGAFGLLLSGRGLRRRRRRRAGSD